MRFLGWRAWYANDSEYCSRTERWEDLPEDGFVVGMVYRDDAGSIYRMSLIGNEHYFKAKDPVGFGWVYAQSNDSAEEILRRYPGASVKRGQWVSDEHMTALSERAHKAVW